MWRTGSKGIENIFKRILREKFPELEKEMPTQMQEVFRKPDIEEQINLQHNTNE